MTTPTLDRNQTIAHVVLEHSECAQVFQRHRIDFCCRGHLSLEAAAQDRNVDLDALIAELDQTIAGRLTPADADPRLLGTPALVAHIVSTHHEYLRKALPFVQTLAAKVSRVHGDHNPKLRDLDVGVTDLAASLMPHLDDEEQALFPALTAEVPDLAVASEHFTTMLAEHLEVANVLEQIRAAADDFALPEWACNSYRTLFKELEQLEGDVFKHVHLENHVLRPRFAAV
jgi:regulator of cell morphogenesis and NO signaling